MREGLRKIIIGLLFLSFALAVSAISGYWWIPISCPAMNDLNEWFSMVSIFLAFIAFVYFLIKKSKWVIVAFLVCLLGVVALFSFAGCSRKARDSRIFSAISQSRTVMDYIYEQEGHYNNFDCTHQDIAYLCEAIDANKGLKDGKEPIIARDGSINFQQVCIYSAAEEKEGYWICADSGEQWRVGWTNINPASSGFCVDGESAVCPPFVED